MPRISAERNYAEWYRCHDTSTPFWSTVVKARCHYIAKFWEFKSQKETRLVRKLTVKVDSNGIGMLSKRECVQYAMFRLHCRTILRETWRENFEHDLFLYCQSWQCLPIVSAVCCESPVTIFTWTPLRNNVRTDCPTPGRGGSRIPMRPRNVSCWRLSPLAKPITEGIRKKSIEAQGKPVKS